jgi:hypothetical protein
LICSEDAARAELKMTARINGTPSTTSVRAKLGQKFDDPC